MCRDKTEFKVVVPGLCQSKEVAYHSPNLFPIRGRGGMSKWWVFSRQYQISPRKGTTWVTAPSL